MLVFHLSLLLVGAVLFNSLEWVDSNQLDQHKTYPGYMDHCFGGDLWSKAIEFNKETSLLKLSSGIPELTEFSFCWWMKPQGANNEVTYVDYTASDTELIKIETLENLKVEIMTSETVFPDSFANEGEWQHLCITWGGYPDGKVKIYKGGYLVLIKTGLATGESITSGGELTFGHGYKGEMTRFNMWSTALTKDEILAQSEDNANHGCGDVVWWSSIKPSNLIDVSTSTTNDEDLRKSPQFNRFCMDEDKKDTVWNFVDGDDSVQLDYPLPELGAFTICFWIQLTDTSTSDQAILSYYIKGDSIGSIVLENVGDLQMTIDNQQSKTSMLSFLDGQWHHVCVTWDSLSGQHKYYKDGGVTGRRLLARHKVVRTGGTLVIGQKQEGDELTYSGHRLRGKLSNFNMWKTRLPKQEIQEMAQDHCERTCGDLIWWTYFTDADLEKVKDVSQDIGHCAERHYCDAGVLDDYLWKINNTADWSLAPLPKKIPDLTEFTICYWLDLDPDYSEYSNVAFSYFVNGDTEGSIVVEDVNNLVVIINNHKSEPTGINLNNGSSHFVCLSWASQNGAFKIYTMKELLYTGSGLAAGETVKGGGHLVIGQKQTVLSGGFNKLTAFYGKLRYFNFYSNVLDRKGIRTASQACYPDCGDVVSWRELTHGDLINIKLFNFTCGGIERETTLPPTTLQTTTQTQTTIPETTEQQQQTTTMKIVEHFPTSEPSTEPPKESLDTSEPPETKIESSTVEHVPTSELYLETPAQTDELQTNGPIVTAADEQTTENKATQPPGIPTEEGNTVTTPCLPEQSSVNTPCPDIDGKTTVKDEIPPCLTNIALGKCTEQSSTPWYSKSNTAVDGDKRGSLCSGACTVTDEAFEPWWRVDLGRSETIHYVTLTNAHDCVDQNRLLGAEVRVGDFQDFGKNHLCGVVTKELTDSENINLECQNGPLIGRYVTVQIRCRNGALCLCEVEVWSDGANHKVTGEANTKCCLEGNANIPEQLEEVLEQGHVSYGNGFFAFFYNLCCAPKT